MFICAVSLIKDLRNRLNSWGKILKFSDRWRLTLVMSISILFFLWSSLTTKKGAEKRVSFYVNMTVSQTYLKVSLQQSSEDDSKKLRTLCVDTYVVAVPQLWIVNTFESDQELRSCFFNCGSLSNVCTDKNTIMRVLYTFTTSNLYVLKLASWVSVEW